MGRVNDIYLQYKEQLVKLLKLTVVPGKRFAVMPSQALLTEMGMRMVAGCFNFRGVAGEEALLPTFYNVAGNTSSVPMVCAIVSGRASVRGLMVNGLMIEAGLVQGANLGWGANNNKKSTLIVTETLIDGSNAECIATTLKRAGFEPVAVVTLVDYQENHAAALLSAKLRIPVYAITTKEELLAPLPEEE